MEGKCQSVGGNEPQTAKKKKKKKRISELIIKFKFVPCEISNA
jgi:hypothetical protein